MVQLYICLIRTPGPGPSCATTQGSAGISGISNKLSQRSDPIIFWPSQSFSHNIRLLTRSYLYNWLQSKSVCWWCRASEQVWRMGWITVTSSRPGRGSDHVTRYDMLCDVSAWQSVTTHVTALTLLTSHIRRISSLGPEKCKLCQLYPLLWWGEQTGFRKMDASFIFISRHWHIPGDKTLPLW